MSNIFILLQKWNSSIWIHFSWLCRAASCDYSQVKSVNPATLSSGVWSVGHIEFQCRPPVSCYVQCARQYTLFRTDVQYQLSPIVLLPVRKVKKEEAFYDYLSLPPSSFLFLFLLCSLHFVFKISLSSETNISDCSETDTLHTIVVYAINMLIHDTWCQMIFSIQLFVMNDELKNKKSHPRPPLKN